MTKKIRTRQLNKDIKRSITGSMGRFLSIFSLMLLGVFVFIGLKVAGPDMRETADKFYRTHQLADLTVTSTWGLDETDEKALVSADNVKKVELGTFQDVLIEKDKKAIRIFSQPESLSTYEVMSGQMPQNKNEIALDYRFEGDYQLGQNLVLETEKKDAVNLLEPSEFKIVGFVKSSEYVDKNDFGQTTVGTGQLTGYAVVSPTAFNGQMSTIARVNFDNLTNLSPYDDLYKERVSTDKSHLQALLDKEALLRLKDKKAEGQKQINSGQAELTQAQQELTLQKNNLENQKLQMQAAKAAGMAVPESQSAQIEVAVEKLSNAQNELTQNQKKLDEKQKTLDQLSAPVYTVSDRNTSNPGYQNFVDNSTRIDQLSNIFPVVLFAIAALVSLTTMTRFVEEERTNLGILKALGYTNGQIRRKFIIYGLVSSILGALVGVVLGHYLLPPLVFNAYTASSTFSNLSLIFSVKWTLIALLIAIACTVFPAYWTSREVLAHEPATLFVAKAPKAGSRILLEKIPFIWKHMSFNYKVTARNLFRYKKRMLMTIIGIAGCTALLVMGFGIRDSIAGLSSKQFGNLMHYNLIAVEKDDLSSQQNEALNARLSDEAVKNHTAVHFEQLSSLTEDDENRQTVQLIVPEEPQDIGTFIRLQNRQSKQALKLNDDGAIITEKLARLLDKKVGDKISLTTENHQTVTVKISAITEMYMGHYLYLSPTAYESAFKKDYDTNAQLVSLKNPTSKEVNQFSYDLMQTGGILTVSQNTSLQATINSFLYGINSVMFVLIICAILLAVVVIYNLTNINVSERIRELSTIKVLGFYDREVTLYIYRETILLSVIGIVCGFGLGAYFHHVIITMLPTDMVMFSPSLTATNLALSAAITMATTLALSLMVHRKLKHVDMLGALKSVD